MRRSLRQQGIYILSFLVAAVPFAFALIRAAQTGSDFRYVWMAVASFMGYAAVIAMGKARAEGPNASRGVSVAAFAAATLLAGLTGYLLGARSPAGILIVSIAFALCWAASYALNTLSRPKAP
jgi:hypothetical protein